MSGGWRHLCTAALVLAVGLLCAAGLVLATGPVPGRADAYTLHGFRWNRPVVGYSVGDARLQPYADNALRLWSEPSMLRAEPGGSDIRIVVGALRAPILYERQPAQANVQHAGGWITSCEVRIDPSSFFNLEEWARQAVLTHELGHCLGLDHSRVPSIMQSPYLYAFSADDAAAIRTLYGERQSLGLRFRFVVGELAASR